jgi:CBS domain-containing protein
MATGGTGRRERQEADMGTKVRDVMTHRPRCVSADTPVTQAAALMESEDVGAVPVLDGEQLAGMVTDRDIVTRAVALGKDPRGMPVREVASRDVVVIGPDEDLSDALRLMAQHQVRRLPVIDDDSRLVGMLSQADVALEAKDKTVGEVVEAISAPPEGPRSA